ncbi:lytic transglycosylase domain-containing protein [Methylobacterium sp.]|uniref:lytic transglycosylase domain-containing protein n=1 Tax=Methylobacterium sp. TaxID=409 RepID=UPI003B014712
MAAAYSGLIVREASGRGLPPAVADAVAFVESGYDARAVGGLGELGLMQVLPSTAAMLGHRGPAEELLDPGINVRFGVAYLAGAWKLAQGDLCRTLMKYRAGHGALTMTARSVEYCRRARERLAATGSPLAGAALPQVAPPRAGTTMVGRRPRDTERPAVEMRSGRLWAEHVARVRAAEARVDRIMGGG